ncbi:hypothetical protein ACEWY4_008543 [Coilia grayii]|uniref:Ubiquitin-like protease family profile domain-containing protein n=1 Tax=Coilia grayii TaxID=363190 RepID=A0ABD1KB91_9TELE
MDAVVGTSLFSGRFRSFSKMKFPVEECWLCPLNFSAHWILVIVDIPTLTLVLIDPMGNEDYYDRKVLRNWRNFLKMMGRSTESWQVRTLQHHKQQDSSSCGVLVLKFAERFILTGNAEEVLTTAEAMKQCRGQIACTLLKNRGNAEDYCLVCSMLESDAERSMIEMVQCGTCLRWAHFECAKYCDPHSDYKCSKCS